MNKKLLNNVITKYLGTNYKFNGQNIEEGLDCINLCCLVAKDLDFFIPNINHLNNTIENYSGLFGMKDNKSLWESSEPMLNRLALFKINGVIKHVGYMLNEFEFIHIMEGSKVTVDTLENIQWKRRIVGCYRYVGDKKEI